MVGTSPVFGSGRRGRLAATLALASGLLLGCERTATEARLAVRVDTLAKASVRADEPARVREVVRDQGRYEAVWRELWGGREVGRPAVDFDREMVIVVTHPVDYCLAEVEIGEIVARKSGFLVEVGESNPHFCECAWGETTFHMVRSPRLSGPVDFATHAIRSRCG